MPNSPSSRVCHFLHALLLLGLVASLRPAHAANFVVSNLNDSGAGSLREAMGNANNAASGGDSTIAFVPELKGAIVLNSPLPEVASTMSIAGHAGLALDGGKKVRPFSLAARGHLTLAALDVRGGRDAVSGGVFLSVGGTLEVKGCAFTGNRSDGAGGVLFSRAGATASFSDCTFRGNTAKTSGSVAFNADASQGGASTLALVRCSFDGNSGPALDNGKGSTASLSESKVARAATTGSAGAVLNAGTMTLSRCAFSGNTSQGDGGAIINAEGAGLLVDSCTLSNNAARSGGAIMSRGDVRLVNSTLAFNTARGGYGGAALTLGAASRTLMEFCTLVGNITPDATSSGALNDGESALVVRNCLFVANGTGAFGKVLLDPGFAGDGNGNLSFANAKAAGLLVDASGYALLAPNGGPTPTFALKAGSPAIDVAVPGGNVPPFDQRGQGFPRASGQGTDVGAFELQQ